MITAKQRAKLRSLTHNLIVSVQVGKDGVTDNVLNEIDVALENKELIKVKLLKNSDCPAKQAINDISNKVKAEPVMAIGGIIVLYRMSNKEGIKHIEI